MYIYTGHSLICPKYALVNKGIRTRINQNEQMSIFVGKGRCIYFSLWTSVVFQTFLNLCEDIIDFPRTKYAVASKKNIQLLQNHCIITITCMHIQVSMSTCKSQFIFRYFLYNIPYRKTVVYMESNEMIQIMHSRLISLREGAKFKRSWVWTLLAQPLASPLPCFVTQLPGTLRFTWE